jgi:glycosyltransferase involved in cell wall biosynthesis
MRKGRRLISIGHSYVVAVNRRLAHEMARVGGWEVTAVAPTLFRGDSRPIAFEPQENELCRVEQARANFTSKIHLMLYSQRLRELMRQPWDMVHCWEEPFVFAGGQVALLTPRKTPFVFYSFQNISKTYPPPFCWIERYCLQRCAGWLAAGESVCQTLSGRGYSQKPHRIIPLGVDVDRFSPDVESRLAVYKDLSWSSKGAPVVGYLGRFVPEKGLDLLMRALESLSTPWRALFVGSGPMERSLRNWSERYGDRARVVTGVSHGEVPRYLNAMDVLCAPSQTTAHWREQFGRMIIEAFACGVPVIGSDSGEIPQVVGNAGVLVAESDVSLWAGKIGELVENLPLRSELSRTGLERARSLYAWSHIARRHLDFFEELLG